MKLYFSTSSPFVRKVNVCAIELGLDKKIERILTNPWVDNAGLLADNPLSKVPTLVTDDGMVIYDSPVICEYLDSLHNGDKLIPASGRERWEVLRLQALADGLTEAAVLRFLERSRDVTLRSADFEAKQKAAVQRALTYLEQQALGWGESLNVGVVAVACALGYLDFRFADEPWREACPALTGWFGKMMQRDSLATTLPKPMPA